MRSTFTAYLVAFPLATTFGFSYYYDDDSTTGFTTFLVTTGFLTSSSEEDDRFFKACFACFPSFFEATTGAFLGATISSSLYSYEETGFTAFFTYFLTTFGFYSDSSSLSDFGLTGFLTALSTEPFLAFTAGCSSTEAFDPFLAGLTAFFFC